MNEIDTLIIIGVVFLVYGLPLVFMWFERRNHYKKYGGEPNFDDVLNVLLPVYNLVFSVFMIASMISDAIENNKINFSKFFKL